MLATLRNSALVFLAALFAAPTLASAGHGPPPPRRRGDSVVVYEKHVKVVRRRRALRRRHRRPRVRPNRPVVLHRPARVVVVDRRPRTRVVYRSAPAPAPAYAASDRPAVEDTGYTSFWRDRGLLGVGLRMSGVALEGQKIHLSTLENPAMFGPGLTFTGRVAPNWDLELAVDYLVGSNEDFNQRTVPITLSGMYLFFPDSRLTPYAVLGGGIYFTQLNYGDGAFTHEMTEFGGHLGGGVKIRLGQYLALTADVRVNLIYKDLGTTTTVAEKCVAAGACRGIGAVSPDDKLDTGVTFQAGAVFYF